MSGICLRGVSKSYGETSVVRNIDLEIGDGEFVTVLGASGSGKTTCLRMVAGFVTPTTGKVIVGGKDVTFVPPYRRNTGMVFQQYALFPHLSIEENVAFGLRIKKVDAESRRTRVADVLELVGLEKLAKRYPNQLSGGQRQRVALARAVVVKPDVLLLDEPLSALDAKLREELRTEIRELQRNLHTTTMFVTHDQDEALMLSDRVVVMREGQIIQVDTPTQLYRHPKNLYVASFVGRINVFKAEIISNLQENDGYVVKLDGCNMPNMEVRSSFQESYDIGEQCYVGFRPEDGYFGEPSACAVAASVAKIEYVGDGWNITCQSDINRKMDISLSPRAPVPEVGMNVNVQWNPGASILLKAA